MLPEPDEGLVLPLCPEALLELPDMPEFEDELPVSLPAVLLGGFEADVEELPGLCAVLELLDGLVFIEPDVLVSVPVWAVDVDPVLGVLVVPCGVFCDPAVDDVPSIEPDCVVPLDAVRVFLLLLLQPNTNAAASARPYAYFIRCLLTGLLRRLGGAPLRARKSPAAPER